MPKYDTLDVQLTRPAGLTDFQVGMQTVGTTAAVLTIGFRGRYGLIVYPPADGVVYVGKQGVTANTGIPVQAGSSPLQMDFIPSENVTLYAIADAAGRQIRVVEYK